MARSIAKLSLAFALCATISACGEEDDSVPDESRGVFGVVTDGQSGKKLKGVTVAFTSDTLDKSDDTTNSDGEYRLTVATDSKNGRVEAKKSGYETRVVSVFFDSESVQVDLELTPN